VSTRLLVKSGNLVIQTYLYRNMYSRREISHYSKPIKNVVLCPGLGWTYHFDMDIDF
jgi:hypothetical protein